MAAVILAPLYLTIAINKLTQPVSSSVFESCLLESITNGAVNCLFNGSGDVSPLKIALPILIIIIIPLIMAYYTQRQFNKKYNKDGLMIIKQKFAAFSNLGLLVMLFSLMGINQNKIIFERPDLILKAFVPLLIFYIISFVISILLYKYKGGSEGKALAWGTYLRYITLSLGLAVSLVYQN